MYQIWRYLNKNPFRNFKYQYGVGIDVTYSGIEPVGNLHWTQDVTTNSPLGTGTFVNYNIITNMTTSHDNSLSGYKDWFYSPTQLKPHIIGCGYRITFQDAPRRSVSLHNPYVSWSAQLYLMNNNSPVLRISYGFTLSLYKGLTVLPYNYYIYPQKNNK